MAATAAKPATASTRTQLPRPQLGAASAPLSGRIGAPPARAAAALVLPGLQECGRQQRLRTAAAGTSSTAPSRGRQQQACAMAGGAAEGSGKTKVLFVCLGNICRWVGRSAGSCNLPPAQHAQKGLCMPAGPLLTLRLCLPACRSPSAEAVFKSGAWCTQPAVAGLHSSALHHAPVAPLIHVCVAFDRTRACGVSCSGGAGRCGRPVRD